MILGTKLKQLRVMLPPYSMFLYFKRKENKGTKSEKSAEEKREKHMKKHFKPSLMTGQ